MTTRPSRQFWLKLAAGLLFSVVAYGGAYLAMVEPSNWSLSTSRYQIATPAYLEKHVSGRAQASLQTLFSPAHWLDRTLRPGLWPWPEALGKYQWRDAIRP